MIVKKTWIAKAYGGTPKYNMRGWYLLGFIPLYIIKEEIA